MAYSLSASYAGESLLSGFNWFNGADPSHGYVAYQDRDSAQSMGLYSIDETTGVVRLGVDHTNKYPLSQGRPSIRLESKQAYNQGLFIADFLHMPPSQCGLWPAFWSYGNDWPNGGEIDIIEGVNTAHNNIMSAHTADGCTQSPSLAGLFTGEQRSSGCAVGDDNIGCGFDPPASDTSSYGDGFNAVNGGVYAMKWDSGHISLWHFPRGSIPADIEAKNPDPAVWGLPQAVFGGPSCDVDTYWKNMNIVINTNFCGDYGSAIWGKTDSCTDFAATCPEYVANSPEAFANAYWDVRYIDAYEFNPDAGNVGSTTTAQPTTEEPTTTITTTSFYTTTVTVGRTHGNATGLLTSVISSAVSLVPSYLNATTATPVITSIQPVATKTPVNPAKIGDYSYLGCFESDTDFQTFREVADSMDMTPEHCVELCHGKTYAGVFNTKCSCANDMDADTRAGASEGLCNNSCPGDDMQFCGGIIKHQKNQQQHNISSSPPFSAPSASAAAPSGRIFSRPDNSTVEAHLHRLLRVRRAASDAYALTVYGAVSDDSPAPPPAMAPGSNVTFADVASPIDAVASVSYVTVVPVPVHKTFEAKASTALTTVGTDDDTPDTEVGVMVTTNFTDLSESASSGGDEIELSGEIEIEVSGDDDFEPCSEGEIQLPSSPTPLPWTMPKWLPSNVSTLNTSTIAASNAPTLPLSSESTLPVAPIETPTFLPSSKPALPPPPPPPASMFMLVKNPVQNTTVQNTTAEPSTVVVAAAPGSLGEVKRSAMLGLAALVMVML